MRRVPSGKTSWVTKLFAVAICACAFLVAACSDDDNQNVREQVEDAAGSATARVAAETMRAALEAQDLDSGATLRDVTVLRENANDVPGDPRVSGIEDADGDGKDDDGKVELRAGDQAACVTVTDGNDVSVANDAC
jgi:hypothetical protein